MTRFALLPVALSAAALILLLGTAGTSLAGPPAPPPPPPAPPPAPDSSLHRYMSGLADSSHTWFGSDTLDFDTTGVDSLGKLYTEHPELAPRQSRDYDPKAQGSENAPLVRVSAVERPFAGARLQLNGIERGPGALSLEGGYALGIKESRFAAGLTRAFSSNDMAFSAHLSAYRSTSHFDAVEVEPDPTFEGPRWKLRSAGLEDRREGWRARALLRTRSFALQGTWRDEQAHTLEYPGGFGGYLLSGTPATRKTAPGTLRSLAASIGIGRQSVDALLRGEIEHAGFGGKFEFNRARLGVGRVFRIGVAALLGLEAEWSAADSGAPSQEQFYAGGSNSLSGWEFGSLQARQLYLGRATLVFGPDVLTSLRIPHPAILPISFATFVDVGAAPVLEASDGLSPRSPSSGDWRTSAGLGLWYAPGIPDPATYIKLSAAVPIGPQSDHRVKWSLTWSRLLDWF